jgi:eukaryotic-like serine/threonine-protein kinase
LTLDTTLVIADDVRVVRVGDLAPGVRAALDALDDDYTITKARSRVSSLVIDRDGAALLAQFRSPRRVVDAVLDFATERALDPEETLDEAYALLARFADAGVLVPEDTAAQAAAPDRAVGSVIGGFELLRCEQGLEDSAVFLARDEWGEFAAVKLTHGPLRPSNSGLEYEAAMLRRAAPRAPAVHTITPIEGGAALVMEWVFGLDVAQFAAGLRGRRQPRDDRQLLMLCRNVAGAYADLHTSGILHGDVHPGNILVEPAGAIRLVDFGLAKTTESSERTPPRGGVPFYFDPQFACAQLEGTSVALHPAAEQYAVAVLIYQLWCGAPYVDWKLERTVMLQQIMVEEPASFASRGVPPWPALEAVLRRALDKEPDRRFPSMAAFARALDELLPKTRIQPPDRAPHADEELLARTISRYDLSGEALRTGPADAPLASVNHGAAGVAYALHRLAQARGSSHLLALADLWIAKAYTLSGHESAFYRADFGIEPKTVGDGSLFHSALGLSLVRAVISVAQGDIGTAQRAVESFVQHARQHPSDAPDLTVGTASVLLGCAELVETAPSAGLDLQAVRRLGDTLAGCMLAVMDGHDIATTRALTALGVAHGWAGLLFALLRWTNATATVPARSVRERLEELMALAQPHAGGLRWPVNNATRPAEFMDGWCNGTAGHALLLALAYEIFTDPRYGEMAERAAESAWATDLQVGTLCCGLGGLGYAFLAVHRVTGDTRWTDRARIVARRAARDNSKYFFRDALYKGAVGVAVLAQDVHHPAHAVMPLLEPTARVELRPLDASSRTAASQLLAAASP